MHAHPPPVLERLRPPPAAVPTVRAEFVRFAGMMLCACGPIYAIVFWLLGAGELAAGCVLAAGLVLHIARRPGVKDAPERSGNAMVAILFVFLGWLTWRTGGLRSPAMPWTMAVPMVAMCLCGKRSGLFWTFVVCAEVLALYLMEVHGVSFPREFGPGGMRILQATGLIGIAILSLSVVLAADSFRKKMRAEMDELRSVLPICMHCRKVRNEKNVWQGLDHYVESHSSTLFSHGLCDDCLEKHYGGS